MQIKKIVAVLLAVVMMSTLATTAFAIETDDEYTVSVSSQFINSGGAATDGGASIMGNFAYGEGVLDSSNYPFFKPDAKARTTYYHGLAAYIYAIVACVDANNGTTSSDPAEYNNMPEAVTNKLTSPTDKCTFNSTHKIRELGSTYTETRTNTITWPKS